MEENKGKKHPLAIGMRTTKTALSVLVCLILYNLTSGMGLASRFDAFLAVTASIICMQETVEKSVSSGLHRVYGTVAGALLGMIFLYIDMLFKNEYLISLMIALGIIVLIALFNALNISNSIVIGCVVFLIIVLEQTSEPPVFSSARRLIDTVVGIVIAIVINHFIHNPDAQDKQPSL
jgi:uncharacterized membrane protein YgaE (UPF0421/DUF939 family)